MRVLLGQFVICMSILFGHVVFAKSPSIVKNAEKAVKDATKAAKDTIVDVAEDATKLAKKNAEQIAHKTLDQAEELTSKMINKVGSVTDSITNELKHSADAVKKASKSKLKQLSKEFDPSITFAAANNKPKPHHSKKAAINMKENVKQEILEVLGHPLFKKAKYFIRFTIVCKNNSLFHQLVGFMGDFDRAEASILMRSDMGVIVSFKEKELYAALKKPDHNAEAEQFMRLFGVMISAIALHRYAKNNSHQVYPFLGFPQTQLSTIIPEESRPVIMYGVCQNYAKSSLYGNNC